MKVVVVEDIVMLHEVMRKACHDLGHEVLATTTSGRKAVELCEALRPDALLLDLQLVDISGGEVIDELERRQLAVQVIVISAYLSDYVVYRIERSRVKAVIDKNTHAPSAIGEALAAVARGHSWYSPSFQEAKWQRRADPRAFDKLLTEAEQTFLRLVAHGYSDADIAERLGISPRTAEGHRSRILKKLGVESTTKLLAYALSKGFHLFPPLSRQASRSTACDAAPVITDGRRPTRDPFESR